ncbi:MAG: putative toxin-antitoxin system toxin component, PIN family [Actinomycetota bacterium]|nr:MAG: putative toxin-antitoxin system toxin component, PIN family [Actinomycetota bacterium]
MRVLLDTNIIISALLFRSSTPSTVVEVVLQEHRLVRTEWVIAELREVVGRKRPDLVPALERFLSSIDYELVSPGDTAVAISDPDDQPILDAATASAVDVIVTGDKHFLTLNIETPLILTARAFVEAYVRST